MYVTLGWALEANTSTPSLCTCLPGGEWIDATRHVESPGAVVREGECKIRLPPWKVPFLGRIPPWEGDHAAWTLMIRDT